MVKVKFLNPAIMQDIVSTNEDAIDSIWNGADFVMTSDIDEYDFAENMLPSIIDFGIRNWKDGYNGCLFAWIEGTMTCIWKGSSEKEVLDKILQIVVREHIYEYANKNLKPFIEATNNLGDRIKQVG